MNAFAKLRVYDEYKRTRVKWLEEVPSHWDEYPICSKAKLKSITNKVGEDLLSVYLDKGVIRFDEVEQKRTNVTSLDLSKYQLVEVGDFVLNNQQAWRGSVGVSSYRGIVSPAYLVLSLARDLLPNFANYLFRDGGMVSHYLISSKGVGTIQRNLYWPQLKRAPLFIPPVEEQISIANFLDQKTAQIDEAIAIKEKQIELLKERKQIIIQKAVTRGLNTDVPMKDSGVDWIGEIPEHWAVKRLKHLAFIQNGQVDPKLPKYKHQILIAPNHIESGGGRILYKETADEQGAESGKYPVKKGALLYSKIRPELRKACIAEEDGMCSADMYSILPSQQIVSEFLLLVFLGEKFSGFMINQSMRVAMPKVNRNDVTNYWLSVPPVDEQLRIVEKVKAVSITIDEASNLLKAQIQKLREYKATLINNAVTGKIKVA
ncbi:MAG: restriction endonuclease subunit S [Pseudoalteromonas sp.]|nr:restriction endonuclease subunit S [Pseudoalteromonas sp.]